MSMPRKYDLVSIDFNGEILLGKIAVKEGKFYKVSSFNTLF